MKCTIALASLLFAASVVGQSPTLEMRLLATGDYSAGGVEFDLAKEKLRLRAWLDARGNRGKVLGDPQAIHDFNAARPEEGGPLSPQLRWYPSIVRAGGDPLRWDSSYAMSSPEASIVPLFSREQYAAKPADAGAMLVELFPINMHARHFRSRDFDPDEIEIVDNPDGGGRALQYTVDDDLRGEFADWSQENIGSACAVLVDHEVRSAPIFNSRMPGYGLITGNFRDGELDQLARALQSQPSTTVVSGANDGPAPAGSDPADIRAMQGAEAMLVAEAKLREMVKAGKIGGVDRIVTFEEISSWPYEDGLLGMPEPVKKLDGEQVLMTGFMLPIDEVENIKEFLLVQSLWSCCYGQPPDINGIVRVVMKGDARIDYQFDPIKVVGTFEVEATHEDGYCVDIYQLHADSVEVIR